MPTRRFAPQGTNPNVNVELTKSYRVQAAHHLPNVPEGHKCRNLHGHTYRIEVTVAGEVDERTGWLADFHTINEAIAPLREQIDHRNLNDVPGLENPTSERLAKWLWDGLIQALPGLSAVTVWENESARCTYYGQ
jgi:6-pyruvoyltetrahydropterin/6-carboxytetrahydropterin synthase